MDYGYANPLLHHQPSLPMLNTSVPSMPPYNHLNNSFLSPSLMIGQFTFSTPTSISQSSFNANVHAAVPLQLTQPITHTITFGDEKIQDQSSYQYDELEAKMKQLNQYASTSTQAEKGPISAASLSTKLVIQPVALPPTKPSVSGKSLAGNTDTKNAEVEYKPTTENAKQPAEQPTTEPPKKTVPVKNPVSNSLKSAVIADQQEPSQHDQAIK